MLPVPVQVAARVARALENLHVVYLVGGSLASSTYGIPRTTQDVDLVADLRPEHIAPLVSALADEFYVDADRVRDAVRDRASFNVIHLPTMYKADIFVVQPDPWAREELARRRTERVGTGEDAICLYFCSPEDAVLHKLEWYRAGGGVSERQWNDVLGVLKVQAEALDQDYLRHWSTELGLTDLLNRALQDTGRPAESC
jgi:hypothetical protein